MDRRDMYPDFSRAQENLEKAGRNVWGEALMDKSPINFCMAPPQVRDGAPVLQGAASKVLEFVHGNKDLQAKLKVEDINLETLEFTSDGNTFKAANSGTANIILYLKQGEYEITASKSFSLFHKDSKLVGPGVLSEQWEVVRSDPS